MKTEWEKQVTALTKFYADVDAEKTVGDKPVLPKTGIPVVPKLPAAYSGPVSKDFIYKYGYG